MVFLDLGRPQVNSRFPTLPFTLRAGKDERAWRMGVVECKNHGMFVEYPVLFEKPDELVAQVKFTALLLPSGNVARTTGGPPPAVESELAIEDPVRPAHASPPSQTFSESGGDGAGPAQLRLRPARASLGSGR